jgi:large subunit ribosomal protein L23
MALFGRKKKVEEEKVEEVKTKATKKTTATKPAIAKAKAGKKATKTETTETPVLAVKAKKEEVVSTGKSDYGYRITEKATRLADKNVYVLNVPKTINKTQLKNDLVKKYKVTVLGINMINSAKKDKFYKGKWGTRGGGKKAYITLKAGDSIVL